MIAGGGISGLALAAALQAAPEASRPKVIVMERDASAEARRQGYGVTLSETNAALAGLGILEDLRASNTRSCAHWTFKDDGSVLGYFGLAFLPEERKKPKRDRLTNLRVPRNRVREILLKRLLPGTVRFGCRVVDYEEVRDDTGSSVVVVIEKRVPSSDDETSQNNQTKVGGGAGRPEWAENEVKKTGGVDEGSSFVATETLRGVSMLVASDGVRSAVQRRRMPGASLNYLGVVLITGFTQLRHPLLEKQGFYTLDGKRARVFTMPFSSDEDVMKHEVNDENVIRKSMWQISVRVTEAEARALASAPRALASDFDARADAFSSVRAFVRTVAGTWHDPLPAMFNTTDWESVWCGPLYDRDEPPRPKTKTNAVSRVTAVGDAAHPMSPFKGMGANTALFDAWHLARWLLKAPVPRAIACFEREMFARAWGKVRASREACVAFHSKQAVDETKSEFAGVKPELVPWFLSALRVNGVGAALGSRLEAETKQALEEFRTRDVISRTDERVKPYAYRKTKQGDKDVCAETENSAASKKGGAKEKETQSDAKNENVEGSSRRRVPPPALASRVEAAFHEAVRRVSAPPLTADEAAVARSLVPAAASRKARSAHDWTSRAALKIAHERRKTFFSSQPSLSDKKQTPNESPRVENADGSVFDSPDAFAARLARVCAEVLEETDPFSSSSLDESDDDKKPVVAAARASPDGQLFVVSGARALALSKSGLATCVGCGKFFAVHGGGLRQHWARGGDGKACARAADAATNASMTDAEAKKATGGLVGARVESSAWRGAGEGRPGPWRETMRSIERGDDENGVVRGTEVDLSRASPCVSVATVTTKKTLRAKGEKESPDEKESPEKASEKEIAKLRRRNAGLAAAAIGDVAAMVFECERGAFDPVTDTDPHGSSALHWAAGGGHTAACEWLVGEKNVPVDATRRKDGRAPTHWAARNGRLEVLAWLVSRGADANAVTYDGDTPFNLAVWQGHDHVARFLVETVPGVDPTKRNRWGCNALLWACTRTRSPATPFEEGNVGDAFIDSKGNESSRVLETVKWLVDTLGVPVDVVNVNGHGAIHKCAIYGHGEVIDWLTSSANVGSLDARHFAPDDRNSAPSDLARTNGHIALSLTLRALEDRRSRVPVVYDGGARRGLGPS